MSACHSLVSDDAVRHVVIELVVVGVVVVVAVAVVVVAACGGL